MAGLGTTPAGRVPLPGRAGPGPATGVAGGPGRRRILFVNHTAQMGGGEVALLNIVRHLDRSRFDPVVILFADGPLADRLAEAGVDARVVPLAGSVVNARKGVLGWGSLLRVSDAWRAARHVVAVAREVRRSGADLVHANSLKADVIAGLAGRLAGVPVVWHVRDRIADDYLPPAAARAFRWLARSVPHHVVANSRATLATLRLPPGRPGTAVYSGTVTDDLPPAPSPAASGPVVGLVGRISPWKGQHIFVRAAAELHRLYPACRFQVIGGPLFGEAAYDRDVRAMAARMGLAGVVEFTGHRADVPQRIAALDVLVHASTAGEPFGQVVAEAMAAGKPVVATRGGGVPEVVVDGVTGLLVPMGDVSAMARAIARLLDDPAAAAAMGRAGRVRIEQQFTIGHTVARLATVWDRTIRKARRTTVV